MRRFNASRTASLIISLFGAIFNIALAVRVLAAWRSIKWEAESEWEGAMDKWRVDGVKLVWGLLSAYFLAAATACTVGFVGIVKNRPSQVRFYRDYSIADFSFCALFAVLGTYASFLPSVRSGICEELSRQPELMAGMVEMGLNLENCESWWKRVVFALTCGIIVMIVVRLHFLVAVSHYYSHLTHHASSSYTPLPSHSHSHSHSHSPLRRIYLLPRSSANTTTPAEPMVYAPVPLSTLSPSLRSTATEAWISSSSAGTSRHHHHRSSGSTGRISLPIVDGEPLLAEK